MHIKWYIPPQAYKKDLFTIKLVRYLLLMKKWKKKKRKSTGVLKMQCAGACLVFYVSKMKKGQNVSGGVLGCEVKEQKK